MPPRYFYVFFTALDVVFVVLLGLFMPKKLYLLLYVCIIVIASCTQIVFYSALLAENKVINQEIDEHFMKAGELGLDTVIVLNSDGPYGQVLTNRLSYHADSPFDSAQMNWWYCLRNENKYHLQNILYVSSFESIKELESKIEVLDSITKLPVTVDKASCFFTGLIDLEYNNASSRNPQRAYYYSWDEFKNSPAYAKIEVFSMNNNSYGPWDEQMGYQAMMADGPIWIKCGITENSSKYCADKPYDGERDENGLAYGYSGETAVNCINRLYDYYYVNRYGNSFSYTFDGISNGQYVLAFDIYELWHTKPRERFFDIYVETSENHFTITGFDPFVVANNQQTPLRVLIYLPECEYAKITFNKNALCDDVPFINGIGLLQRPSE